MAESKVYITAGLPALDSAGTPETDDKSRAYITAGLPANDYEAAGGDTAIPVFMYNYRVRRV